MIRNFLVLSLAIPLCGHCQSYAGSPFYSPVSAIPSTAHVEGYAHGSIKANGIVIDLSELVPWSSPDMDEIRGGEIVQADVDGRKPTQLFRFYRQYGRLNVVFGYDLLAEPVEGTDKIKCTFSALTDLPVSYWHHNKEIAPVALPADLTPLVIESGDVISIATLPLGPGRIAVVHYLRLTRTDVTPDLANNDPTDNGTADPDFAEPRGDLLRRVADHYRSASSFEVKGTATALVPGTSWRASYDFDTEAAQPSFLPLSLRTASMQFVSTVGNPGETLAVEGATDPKPPNRFGMVPFGQYNELARRLIDAQEIGTETMTVEGHTYPCEIIDAAYDYSPSFKPHSVIQHKHFSIDPRELLVLRETKTTAGLDWTAEVTAFSFDRPPSEKMLKSLKNFAARAKDRPDWVGRPVPDLTLAQLSGASVKLSELRGKPVLLDFWGSYCGSCRRTTLYAQDLQRRYSASGLAVLTLTQDTSEDARLWTDYNHVTLPVLLDSDGAAFKAFGIEGVPVTILFDGNGKVVHYWVGLDDPSSMDAVLSAMLQPHP